MIKVQGIAKSYGSVRALQDVGFHVEAGETFGIIGPNGAGKTTTFYCVVGLTQPDAGEVRLGEIDLTALPMFRRARHGISYLPQEASVFQGLTVEDNIRAVLETLPLAAEVKRSRLTGLLEELSITHLAKSKASALSGGERRRLEITRALVLSPTFILLDEPFAGIDPIAVIDIQNIVKQLRERGIGVLVTDHNVRETLGICDRAYILSDGVILEEGTPEKIAESPRAREIYLGKEFRL